jgi:hypothetical protein
LLVTSCRRLALPELSLQGLANVAMALATRRV